MGIRTFLQKHPLFQDFTRIELDELAGLFTCHEYKSGELIIEEGTATNELFLLHTGQAEVFKTEGPRQYILAEICPPEVFGEMSFLDLKERSSSVKAKNGVKAYVLQGEQLDKQPEPLKYKFLIQISKSTMERLRLSGQKTIAELDQRHRFGKFIILTTMAFCLSTFISGFIKTIANILPLYLISLSGGVLLIIIVSLQVKVIGQPLSFFGVTRQRWKSSLVEGIVITALLAGVFQIAWPERKLVMIIAQFFQQVNGWVYIVVSIIQELVFRGIFQTALQEFYQDRRGYLAVFLASLAFAVSHAYYGISTVAMTFFMGLFLGFVYLRHRNLVGVIIIHFLCGCLGIALGLIGA